MAISPLLILADDLTGAADTAARCCGVGLPALIYLQPPRPPLTPGVTAFTSDSRHLPPGAAAARVQELARPLQGQPGRWYKKIDSTLRGNIGSEIDALLDLLALPCAIVCPSFPAQGRGLEDGYLVAPNLPPRSLHLPSLLQEQSRRRIEAIPLATVRSGDFEEELAKALVRGAQLLVVDALADADLAQILMAVAAVIPEALLCGSAGLVGILAESMAGREAAGLTASSTACLAEDSSHEAREGVQVVLVVGSGSEMAHRQVEHLCSEEEVARLLLDSDSPTLAADDLPDRLPRLCLFHLPQPTPGAPLEGPLARRYAEQLGAAAVAFIEKSEPSLLILTGGDTAVSVLGRLGIDRLQVVAELLPGMPLCEGSANDGCSYRVIMKPGSFGDERTLVRLLALAGERGA
jgi:D-threonate/D-erythronate kinase